MDETNPIFKQNYNRYLKQISRLDLSHCESILGLQTDHLNQRLTIPFFETLYHVSPSGVVDNNGKSPDYGIRVILFKYLLMCPQYIPSDKSWIPFREFSDSGQSGNEGLAVYAAQSMAKRYSGKLCDLEFAAKALGGKPPKKDYPYDFSVVVQALPHLPVLLLFNDADEQFPAQATLLYERRAEHILDAECRVMVDWFLLLFLKQAGASMACS